MRNPLGLATAETATTAATNKQSCYANNDVRYLLLAGCKPEDEENTDEEKEATPPGDVDNNTNSGDRDR